MDVRMRLWSVIEGGTLVRSSNSLPGLAAMVSPADLALLAQRLREVDLPLTLSEHPMVQLTKCAQAARLILSEPGVHLSDSHVDAIVAIYEAALLAGYDGMTPPELPETAAGLRGAELSEFSRVGLRHGKTVSNRWSRYQRLVSALFKGDSSC
jgi:hypothetical protein